MAKLCTQCMQGHKINFDLEDCDRILRIEVAHGDIDVNLVVRLFEEHGFSCELLTN